MPLNTDGQATAAATTWADAVTADRTLPYGARLFARELAQHPTNGGLLRWRRADAAAGMLVSVRTVQRWFRALQRRGWLDLVIEGQGDGTIPAYRPVAL